MDIWLAAVLVAWLPVAASLALLVGRSLRQADLRDRRARRRTASPRGATTALPVLLLRRRESVSS